MVHGGRVIIHCFTKNAEGTQPAEAALFALQIGLVTPGGDAHQLPEVTAWMKSAGFHNLQAIEIDTVPSTVIVGTK